MKINLCIWIAGTVMLMVATFLITVPIYSLNNRIDDLGQQRDVLRHRSEYFIRILIKQGQSALLEELYAMQATDMDYRNESSKSEHFIDLVEKKVTDSAVQWASASMGDSISTRENETRNKAQNIRENTQTNFVQKRYLLEELYNENLDIAVQAFSLLQQQLSETQKQITDIEAQKKKYYRFFPWFQIVGLILLALSDIRGKMAKG